MGCVKWKPPLAGKPENEGQESSKTGKDDKSVSSNTSSSKNQVSGAVSGSEGALTTSDYPPWHPANTK